MTTETDTNDGEHEEEQREDWVPDSPDDVDSLTGFRYITYDDEYYIRLVFDESEPKTVSINSDIVPNGLRDISQDMLEKMDSVHADEVPLATRGEM